jgi:MFS transporter, NNP family, nitrate/nitrite transporter
VHARRRQSGAAAPSMASQLAVLKNLQVWRFSLYYFFAFGAFVALALWLPQYIIWVYDVDIRVAGMLAASFSLAASAFRAYGGVLSDRFGARAVMYWTLGFSLILLFMLSYPPTDYVIHGVDGPIRFSTQMGFVPFVITVFVLGFFMSLGKAAVYKHIPVYYPDNVGAVGGLVGMIGGLGGFVLPIAFGVLLDLTGIYTSSFALLFVIVAISLAWMHLSIRAMERAAHGEALDQLPSLPEMQEIHDPRQHAMPRLIEDWRPEDKEFWETKGRAVARRNLWISIPALLLAFSVWMVWSVVVARLPAIGFDFTPDQLFWLAALPALSGATLRIFYSFMVPIFGGRLWTTISTASLLAPAIGIGYAVQNPDTPYLIFLALALLCGLGGANFASSMANINFFFPKAEKGNALALNAGLGNLGVSVMQFLVPIVITVGRVRRSRRPAAGAERRRPAVDAERRLHLGAVHHRGDGGGLARHERYCRRQGIVRRAGHHLHPQAQLDHVRALRRHLRQLHRLLGRLPAAGALRIPAGQFPAVRLPRPPGRCAQPCRDRLGVR